MTPEQIAAICPECHGSGRFDYQVAACCGNVLASGECCGMPVGEHRCDPCEQCQGSASQSAQYWRSKMTDLTPEQVADGTALPEGMVAYGPDHPDYPNAPKDWDQGPYLCRDGGTYHMRGYGWQHGMYCQAEQSDWDRIAYKPEPAMTNEQLAALDAAATQGVWAWEYTNAGCHEIYARSSENGTQLIGEFFQEEFSNRLPASDNGRLACALVNAYRAGQLVVRTEPSDADVERVARAIYENWQFGLWQPGEKPAWQDGGNSIMQELARSFARAAIAAMVR